jgi:hypothetical protein
MGAAPYLCGGDSVGSLHPLRRLGSILSMYIDEGVSVTISQSNPYDAVLTRQCSSW